MVLPLFIANFGDERSAIISELKAFGLTNIKIHITSEIPISVIRENSVKDRMEV